MRFLIAFLLLACAPLAPAQETAQMYQMHIDLGIGDEPVRPLLISTPAGHTFSMSIVSEPNVEGDLQLSGMLEEAGESKRGRPLVDFTLSTTQFTGGKWVKLSDATVTTEVGSVSTLNIDGGEKDISLKTSFVKLAMQAKATGAQCTFEKDGTLVSKGAKDCCRVGCPNPPPGRVLTCCHEYGCCSDMYSCGAGCCVQ